MKPERSEAHQLSNRDFKFICKLVYNNTGIVLGEHKRVMVYRRLMRRTRELKISSFAEYCRFLEDTGNGELPNFINAITTNLTSFFRESHHFDYLRSHFLPHHMAQFGESRRLRIWSAGCSTGEEPYSLAITLCQAFESRLAGWDAKILATDLDTSVLETAGQGIYKTERIADLPKSLQKRWFRRGKGERESLVKVNPMLKKLITFKQLNLQGEWPMRGPFDVIMCRNVLIYFDRATQQELVQRYAELLRPGGVLILGHSESVAKGFRDFQMVGRTIFLKNTAVGECVQ